MRVVVEGEKPPTRRRFKRITLEPDNGDAGVLADKRRLERSVDRTGKRVTHHHARDNRAQEVSVRDNQERMFGTPL